ncbi:hypothetical protein [Nonomuraea sp. CA-141351]|uniref:hypothetical protein n=1 Tax=Nonomuraea sp. CA-141351 TaxID=3239996 RepID=UPI003D8E2FD7
MPLPMPTASTTSTVGGRRHASATQSRVSLGRLCDRERPHRLRDPLARSFEVAIAQQIRPRRISGGRPTLKSDTDGQSECFTYDGLLRLKTAYTTTASSCTGTGDAKGIDPCSQAYAYDKVGDITTLTDNGQIATYTYPAPGSNAVRPNAVTAIARPSGTDTYAYDNNGQLAARTVGGKQATFDWNQFGELTQATVDGQQTGMVYDADGERLIRRDPDGSATLYLGAMELRLAGGQVTAKRYYTTADDGLVAMRDTGGVTRAPAARRSRAAALATRHDLLDALARRKPGHVRLRGGQPIDVLHARDHSPGRWGR